MSLLYLLNVAATISAWVLTALAVVLLSNAAVTRGLGGIALPVPTPRASVLVPARNEEAHIRACVESLLAQAYPDFEVIVLDDDSDDATPTILAELAAGDQRLRVLRGGALPAGWTGKNHACHLLSQAADGALLLFVDADTRHHPRMLADAVAFFAARPLDVLSAMPRLEMPTLGTMLLVPFPAFAASVLQPRVLAYRTRLWFLGALNGQWTMYSRDAYDRLGGHAAVRSDAVEDLALGRKVAAAGMRWRVEDATDYITVRMYDRFAPAWRGFAKNYHALAGPWPFSLLAWLAVLATTLAGPAAVIASLSVGGAVVPLGGLVAIALMVTLWAGAAYLCRLPWPVVPLGWAILTCSALLGLWSIALRIGGRASWKGRRLG